LPSPSWAAAPCSPRPQALAAAAPADPRHTLGPNLVRQSPLGSHPQRSTGGQPAAPGWRQGRTHPAAASAGWFQAWAATSAGTCCAQLDAQAATDLGQDGVSRNFLWRSAVQAVLRRLRPSADALYLRSVARKPSKGERCCSNAFPGPSAALAAARWSPAPARDALLEESLHLARGARAGGSGRQIGRRLCRFQAANHSAPRPAASWPGSPGGKLGDGAGALAWPGNQPGGW